MTGDMERDPGKWGRPCDSVCSDHALIELTVNFAKERHGDDRGHGFDHVWRVYENACSLLAEEPDADAFIVKMTALLHDVDDYKLGGDGRNAGRHLKNLAVSPEISGRIIAAIDEVGFSGKSRPSSPEAMLVSDADKLDAMGAIGICRAIEFGAAANRPLFAPEVFPEQALDQQRYRDLNRRENTTVNHFFDKLLKLKDLTYTAAGKKEAEKRHRFMVDFLKRFFAEQEQTEWNKYLDQYLEG